jgi:hypothetical protein
MSINSVYLSYWATTSKKLQKACCSGNIFERYVPPARTNGLFHQIAPSYSVIFGVCSSYKPVMTPPARTNELFHQIAPSYSVIFGVCSSCNHGNDPSARTTEIRVRIRIPQPQPEGGLPERCLCVSAKTSNRIQTHRNATSISEEAPLRAPAATDNRQR